MKCCVYHTNILIIHYILFSALFKVLRSIFSDVCIFNVNGEYFWLKYLTYLIFPELLATILEFFPKPASSPPLHPPHIPHLGGRPLGLGELETRLSRFTWMGCVNVC